MGFENQAFAELPGIERKALELYKDNPNKARAFVTAYSSSFARAITQRYWELGDALWDLFAYDFIFASEDYEKDIEYWLPLLKKQ